MSRIYTYPQYYALGYRWNTDEECDFVEACLKRWYPRPASRMLDIGCGTGRHLLELAARGYDVVGIDPEPAMVAYAEDQALIRGLTATFARGSLQQFAVDEQFDTAWCFMDTFRFLLTDDEIIAHLRQVAAVLQPDGLYILDFWVPRAAGPPDETHAWEQRSETTHVRVEYLQYSESYDPATRTFDDELIFHVNEDGQQQIIRGGRTRTRRLLPDELAALVAQAGGWRLVGQFDGFNLQQPYTPQAQSWRMVTVLQSATHR